MGKRLKLSLVEKTHEWPTADYGDSNAYTPGKTCPIVHARYVWLITLRKLPSTDNSKGYLLRAGDGSIDGIRRLSSEARTLGIPAWLLASCTTLAWLSPQDLFSI